METIRKEIDNIKGIVRARCHTLYDFSPHNIKKVKDIFFKYVKDSEINKKEKTILKESSRYLLWNEVLNNQKS